MNISLNLTSAFRVAAHSTVITRLDDKYLCFLAAGKAGISEVVGTWKKFSGYLCSSEMGVWLNGQTLHSF